jgi:hypothetical protein
VTEGAQDPDGPGGTAQIRPTTTVEAITVPSSAVVTDSSGTVCVFPAAEAAPVVVHPIGGGIGPVALPADTPITQVLANPADVLARPACG